MPSRHPPHRRHAHLLQLGVTNVVASALVSSLAAGCASSSVPPAAGASPTAAAVGAPRGSGWYFRTAHGDVHIVDWATGLSSDAPYVRLALGGGGVDVAPGGLNLLLIPGGPKEPPVLRTVATGNEMILPPGDYAWAADGVSVCGISGDGARLLKAEVGTGQPPSVVVVHNRPGLYHMVGCNPDSDTFVIEQDAASSTGFSPLAALIERGNGVITGRIDLSQQRDAALLASPDATLLAVNPRSGDGTAEVVETATLRVATRVSHRQVRAISSDSKYLITVAVPPQQSSLEPSVTVELRELTSSRTIWQSDARFEGAIPGPKGRGFALGLGVGPPPAYSIDTLSESGVLHVVDSSGQLI